jgi:hypothetical protein
MTPTLEKSTGTQASELVESQNVYYRPPQRPVRPATPTRKILQPWHLVVMHGLLAASVIATMVYLRPKGQTGLEVVSPALEPTIARPVAPLPTGQAAPLITPTTAATTASSAPAVGATPGTAAPATTAAPAPSTQALAPVDLTTAVWPDAATRIKDPVIAARRFAQEFVGFTSPVVGAFRQGDARSGEVDVQAKPGGPLTTVFVRQLSTDGAWWVLGSATPDIQVDEPAALGLLARPAVLKGTSSATGSIVTVELRQDGQRAPLGTGIVTGGAFGQFAPFTGTLAYKPATAPDGALVLLTKTLDGKVAEATVVRVKLPAR